MNSKQLHIHNIILGLLGRLPGEKFAEYMTSNNYIQRMFRVIKLTEKRLLRIQKLIEEIEKLTTPQDILEKIGRTTTPNYYLMYLYSRYEQEKTIHNITKNKLLHNINLTG